MNTRNITADVITNTGIQGVDAKEMQQLGVYAGVIRFNNWHHLKKLVQATFSAPQEQKKLLHQDQTRAGEVFDSSGVFFSGNIC